MKYFAILLLAGAVLCCTQAPAQKLEHKEHVSKEFTVSAGQAAKNVLAIYNINGFIKVEGYNGDKVVLEIDKKISAKTQEGLDEGGLVRVGLDRAGPPARARPVGAHRMDCPVLAQSARNAARPLSVSGCWKSWRSTAGGSVATSAPSFAACTTCIGWRTEATSTSVAKS